MITKTNLKDLLTTLDFKAQGDLYQKSIGDADLKVDFQRGQIIYPEYRGLKVNERQTCNFSRNENFVVFECVHRLLEKGYKPEHLELEPKWKVGRGASGGRADILVKNQEGNPFLLIECKTAGDEFSKAWEKTQQDGDQLFSYAQQIAEVQYLCLYASDLTDDKIRIDQKVISHRDNQKILEQNTKLLSFANATDVKDRFVVWRDTYQLEHTESGIFEHNIQPYQIGKNNYTLAEDTKAIDAVDKEGQYHKFRTILRKHNIARRENAFEVLVNLFLCKLVDEEDNKTDLKFYWKGHASDNYFDFVDRLQNLYQKGMAKFLKQEISYISNEQIDSAFWTVKNQRNATKKQIQTYFRELKFFTNSAFSFLDTHNKELFYKNSEILSEIVQMWQGIRLKTDRQNQFLGDMFELFLDDGIKQSEGQFFTPLPICKFIIASLPLAQKIQSTSEPIKAVDYACGSGHFLNEYAHQIEPLVEAHGGNLSDYYSQITGIEKEDRLAKVAKVAAYMHGQEQIHVLDADALASHPEIPPETFDVLVANPPFAVEGFLQTLSDEDKQHYQLIKVTGATNNTNTIQCFFIERIHHMLAPGGVVGIIVPSSILSNSDLVHMRTREILLQFFDFVSVVELGSGTFGKTGTNTVVLFLRRKTHKPEIAEHYANRVSDFFEGDTQNEEYQDNRLIQAYCNHIGVPYGEYIKLFAQTNLETLERLLQYDVFKSYQQNFDESTEIKNRKKSNAFKKLTVSSQEAEMESRFRSYLHTIEKDKLLYFILAFEQENNVLIVNAPRANKEQKRYLGYEWSGAKGSEGIKYFGGKTVNDIITPLFDPCDLINDTKINTVIKENFIGNPTNSLPKYCQYSSLIEMLDFSRTDFNKAISLNPKRNIDIESKWDMAKLGEICNLYQPRTITSEEILDEGNYKVYGANGVIGFYHEFNHDLPEVAIACRGATCGTVNFTEAKSWITGNAMVVQPKKDDVLRKFLFEVLGFYDLSPTITGAAQPQITRENLSPYKIPLPPLEIQQQIADRCESVDKETENACQVVDMARQRIQDLVTSAKRSSTLNQAVCRLPDIVNPKEKRGSIIYVGLENIESQTGVLVGDPQSDFSTIKSNKNIFRKGDILYGKLRPNLNKVYLADMDGICSTDILVLRPLQSNTGAFFKHFLLSEEFNSDVLRTVAGQQLPRTSWKKIERIPVPEPDVASKLVAEIKQLESEITQSQTAIDEATERKNAILADYLL